MKPITEQFINKKIIDNRSKNTILQYRKVIKLWFPDGKEDFSEEYIYGKLIEWRNQGLSENYIKSLTVTMNNILAFAEQNDIEIHNSKKIRSVLSEQRGKQTLPTCATIEQYKTILETITDTKYQLILSLMYFCGLRVMEVSGINLKDVTEDGIRIHTRKGNKKETQIPINKTVWNLFQRYVNRDRFNSNPVALFTSINGRLTIPAIQKQIKTYVRAAGFEDLHCHSFRHGYATKLLEDGVELRAIQEVMGHVDITTTQIYTKVTGKLMDQVRTSINKEE